MASHSVGDIETTSVSVHYEDEKVHKSLDVSAGLAGPREGNGGHRGILQAVVTMKTDAIQERLTHPLALCHGCLPMKCFVDQPSASPKFKRSCPYDVTGECASPLCASATSPKKTNADPSASMQEAASWRDFWEWVSPSRAAPSGHSWFLGAIRDLHPGHAWGFLHRCHATQQQTDCYNLLGQVTEGYQSRVGLDRELPCVLQCGEGRDKAGVERKHIFM
jgi:hypothetical protein